MSIWCMSRLRWAAMFTASTRGIELWGTVQLLPRMMLEKIDDCPRDRFVDVKC